MMLGPSLLVQATLLALVGGTKIIHHPILYQHPLDRPVVGGEKELNVRSGDTNLPCPGVGFYVNPQNCSRFYRCVDYAGTGALYSRYHFECPKDHIFLTVAQTCLPGTCIGIVQPVVPPTPRPTPRPTSPPTSPPTFPSPAANPPNPFPTGTTTEAPVVSVEPETQFPQYPTEGPATEAPVTELTPTEGPTGQSCPNTYVQHPVYCNVYNPCNEPYVRYVCPTGTVFDEPRQMCRISAFDDGLCDGKEVFKHTFLLRSENIGAHVRLPDSIILPTALPVRQSYWPTARPAVRPVQNYVRPTARPVQNYVRPVPGSVQSYVRPTASPAQFSLWPTPQPIRTSGEGDATDFEVSRPVFRPLFSRPAQVYSRPDYSPAAFDSFNTAAFNILQPVERIAETPASTQPLAVVRRPEGHLHFPPYDPFNVFRAKRDLEEE